MIKIYPANSRFSADHGWLHSNFSFSFAEYYDPENMGFGPLRVFNDDIIQPNRGFGSHPHQEMEIVSVVLGGYLKHQDSLGNTVTTTFGQVQRMSAGTGIVHSEVNPSLEEEMNLLQLWIEPNQKGLSPSYEHTTFDIEKLKNNLLPVVSHQSAEQVAHIHQDTTIYLSQLEEKRTISYEQKKGRRMYIFVIDGELILQSDTKEKMTLGKRDTARITDVTKLKLISEADSLCMLIDLP